MQLTFDWNNRLTQSKMFLANPQKNYIGVISGAKDLNYSLKFNNMYKVSFKIYKSENGVTNKYYDKIIEKRLIEVQYIGWFQIQGVSEVDDGLAPYKEVELLALENELIGKRIFDISGVYSLYDITDTENSLLHIISKESGWSIAHVDDNLKTKFRTFSVDSAQIYNLLTQDISKSFNCIFIFNSYDRSISAYELENVGELTDIFISKKNILKEWKRESNADQIITKLKVIGADGVDIREVNPTGNNYLINVDYFKTTEWMTQGLINALDYYQAVYDSYFTRYNTTLSLLKQYQSELATLQSELTDLESQKKSAEIVCGTHVTQLGRVPVPSDSEYSLYQTSLGKVNLLTSQIASKKSQISSKQQQIDNTRIVLDNMGVDLSPSKYFSQEQLKELNLFLTENEEYCDSTFIVTEQMKDDEITELQLELMSNGASELQRISQPNYTFNITASNLFSICDNKEGLSYQKWKNKLQLGNLITLQLRDDYCMTVRLIQMDIDFNDLTDIKLTFSNKNRLDNELVQFEEIVAQAGRTASALSLAKFGYDKAADMNSDIQRFISGTLNATLNKMVNNDNQEVTIDQFGLHARKWLPDQNTYSNYQSWWNNNTLMFTNDSWKSSQTAIGLLTSPDGGQFYGVATEVLIGNLILGNKLKIVNTSGTYSIDNNGFSSVNGIYSVVINPNKPSEIFKISVNGTNKLYVDVNTNELVFNGKLTANAINAEMINALNIVASSVKSNWVYAGEIDAKQITAGTIIADKVKSSWVYAGKIAADQIDAGTITGVTIQNSGVQITDNVIKLTNSYGRITNTNNTTMMYCDSRGQLNLGDYTSYLPSIGMYSNTLDQNCETFKLRAGATYSSGSVSISAGNIGALNIDSSVRLSHSSGNVTIDSGSLIELKGYKGINFYISNTSYSLDTLSTRMYAGSLSASSLYLSLNSGWELVPSKSYSFNLGNSSSPFRSIYVQNINHGYGLSSSGSYLGFFGKTAVTKKSVNSVSTSATSTDMINKINELINALQAYGLV